MWSSIFTYTTFLFQKHLQYKLISNTNIKITIIGVPMIENNLTSVGDQKVGGIDLTFH